MNWVSKVLGEIIEQSGQHRAEDQDLPVLSITMNHGLVDQADKFKKRIASSNTSKYRIAYKNELVVGFPIDEGVLGFQTKYDAGIVSPAYNIWRLKSKEDCHIPYLERYLRSPQARSMYASRMQGAVARRRSLTKTDFLNLEVPFPRLDAQIRIAYLLEKVEDLIVRRKQNLQQLDDLLKSIFLKMFGNVALNTKEWELDSLSNLGEFKNGLNYGKGETGVEIKYLGVSDFKAFSKINNMDNLSTISLNQRPSDDYFLQNGDLLFVRSNGNKDLVGRCIAVYPNDEKITYSGFCIRLRLNKNALNPTYLAHLFRAVAFRRLILQGGQGANIQNISQKSLTELPIPVPPLETQNLFASFVEKVEGITALYKESLIDLESLYGTLSQKAFKGELDLSRIKPPTQRIIVSDNEDQSVVSTTATIEQLPTINLSNPNCSAEELYAKDGLRKLIIEWVETYRTQLANEAFSIERFMTAVQNRLMELYPDNEFEMGANAYEYIKEWVFLELEAGRLEQSRNVNSNMIELRAVQS